MPTYEYECETCGHRFDLFQSMNDRRLTRCRPDFCPSAENKGKGKVTRLLGTGAGLIFKGSGFYETDYRSDSYKKGAEKAATAEKSSSSGGGESKSKKKSDAASKSKPAKKASPKKAS